jgi:hypothetical protein
VRREAANRVTIYCWHQRQCGAAGVHLGQCRHISISKLGRIITPALPVATVLICQRAMCVGVCVWVLQCPRLDGWPLPISRYRFKFQSNLVWNLIKPISNLAFLAHTKKKNLKLT